VKDVPEVLGSLMEELLAAYSFLEREDSYAAIEHAAHESNHVIWWRRECV
jgi:hypothetical protein